MDVADAVAQRSSPRRSSIVDRAFMINRFDLRYFNAMVSNRVLGYCPK